MKLHHHQDCTCGHSFAQGRSASGPGSPSTNYFVLGLSLVLVVCGLVQVGVLRFW